MAKKRAATTRRLPASPKQKVMRRYPLAYCWKEFSTSDYSVHSGTGVELASAMYAKDAWAAAARRLQAR